MGWLRRITALLLFALAPVADAANQVVSTLGDNGLSSQLRQKISACQSGSSTGGTITFSVSGTITLDPANGPLPAITKNVTINGGGSIEISGGDATRIFNVAAGGMLTLQSITISHGHSESADGGAVLVDNGGTLNVATSNFSYNATGSNQGGGAITSYGALNISGSEFAFNKAGGGGAINTVFGGATAMITNCKFHDNSTLSGSGGAIYMRDAAPMSLNQVMLTNNKALSQGGAVFVGGSGSRLDVINSQVTSNIANSNGGGIHSQGTLNISTSNIDSNQADAPGGGLFVEGMTTLSGITGSDMTVSSNSSFSGGGGLNATATASVAITNTAFDKNYTNAGDGGGIRSLGSLLCTDVFVTNSIADAGAGDTYGGGIYASGNLDFIGNVSDNKAKHGAGINLNSGTATLRFCFIAFNHAVSGDGGALRVGGGSMSVKGSTIFGNTADNNGGGTLNQATLTFIQTSISINHAGNNGGGIFQVSGNTTLTDSTVDSNETNGFGTGSGGGIYNAGGKIELISSMVDYNVANYRGGGVLNFATLTLDRTLVRNNISYGGDSGLNTYGGGGIYNFGNATITNCVIRDNSTQAQDGGGFYNGWYSTATLTNVTVSNNHAAEDGGGLKNNLGTVYATNVTFSGNTAGDSSHGDGGGIFNDQAVTNLLNVTLSGNSAFNGGGIYNLTTDANQTVTLRNVILAASPHGTNCVSNYPGSLNVSSLGHNLSDDGSMTSIGACPSSQQTDQHNTDPKLGTLANNGGPVVGSENPEQMLTYLPQSISPAVDHGTSGGAPSRDQRGYLRAGAGPDIGAIEAGGVIPNTLANISSRSFVQTGNNVMIGGIIISGSGPKKIILRALGPTLGKPPFNVPNALANPVLYLYDSSGSLITSNDNWMSASNAQAISGSGFAPPSNFESAILANLDPGNYTAIVRGVNNTTGIALVEAYDLDFTAGSKFGNISTRAFVGTGASVMIAGLVVHGPDSEDVIVRALGPTLTQLNVPNVLADPFLDLRDSNGNALMSNDNWKSSQETEIQASGYAPPSDLEPAIVITLSPGNYTAILSGKNNGTGNALIEAYALN